jgi:membrane dipeptidase
LRYITIFFELGIRMMHLTYNRRNMIGDGCAEPANAGLSDFGRAVVAEMNRTGVIVDVAHAGWQTSLEAARASTKPLVASHSAACAVHEHIRGKPDAVIRAIADTGGYVGICCIPRFLGRSGDVNALLDHVDYVARTFGADHVTIGTDVAYTSRNEAREQQKFGRLRKARPRWEAFWPAEDPATAARYGSPEQVESLAWTNWPLFTVGLVQRGYKDADIQKILGGNVLRVARAALSGSGVPTSGTRQEPPMHANSRL